MANHSHVEFDLQDAAGNLYDDGVQVRWFDQDASTFPQVYSDRAGTIPIGNPFSIAPGTTKVSFYTPGGRFQLDLFVDGQWVTLRTNFGIGTAREMDVEDLAGLASSNLTDTLSIDIINSFNRALNIHQTTPTSGVPPVLADGLASLNFIQVVDRADKNTVAFHVELGVQAWAANEFDAKEALLVDMYLAATPTFPGQQLVAGTFYARALIGQNTNTTDIFGLHVNTHGDAGSQGGTQCGIEIDQRIEATADWDRLLGIQVLREGTGQGTDGLDSAYTLGTGTSATWDYGFRWYPNSFSGNSTIIGSPDTTPAFRGIDFTNVTFGSYAFASNGFGVFPEGHIFCQQAYIQEIFLYETAGTSKSTIDASNQAGVTVANGANAIVCPSGAGILVLVTMLSNSHSALYMCGAGAAALFGTVIGGTFAAPTTTPGAGNVSIAWDGTNFRIYNNFGSSQTFKTCVFRPA